MKELEALLAKPKKTSQNSHTPPSQDRKPSKTNIDGIESEHFEFSLRE